MQIYFHSCLCSYLPRVPILVEDTVYTTALITLLLLQLSTLYGIWNIFFWADVFDFLACSDDCISVCSGGWMCPVSNQIVISYLKLISRRIHSCSRHDFDNCENIALVVASCWRVELEYFKSSTGRITFKCHSVAANTNNKHRLRLKKY